MRPLCRHWLGPRLAIVLWLVALSVAFACPVAWGGWVRGHYEGLRYLVLAEHFRDAMAQGAAYPRWLPELYGGYGYPTFVYYQPLIFWWYALWSLPFSGTSAMLAALISVAFIGNVGVYRLARRFGGAPWACAMAGVFLLSPYLYVNLYVRHDLSELTSMFVVPWVLLGIVAVAQATPGRQWRSMSLLALSYAAVIYAHPITGVLLSLLMAPLLVAVPFAGARAAGARALAASFGRVGLAVAAGLLLSCPYWLPFQLMKDLVGLERTVTGGFEATLHTVELQQLFSRHWGFGGSKAGSADGMPLQVGAVHFLLAGFAAAVGRRRPLVVAAAGAYAVCLLSMTPWCEGLWRLPVLDRMQFPWRALAVASALQCFVIASAGPWVAQLPSRHRFGGVAGALLVMVAWQWEQFRVDVRIPNADAAVIAEVGSARRELQSQSSRNEFLPATVTRPPRAARRDEPLLTAAGARVEFAPDSTPYRVRASVTVDRDTRVTVQQFFLPGWRVEIDGQALPERDLIDALDARGLVRAALAVKERGVPQTFALEAYYAGPRGGDLAAALAALAALLLLGASAREAWRQNQLSDSDRLGK